MRAIRARALALGPRSQSVAKPTKPVARHSSIDLPFAAASPVPMQMWPGRVIVQMWATVPLLYLVRGRAQSWC